MVESAEGSTGRVFISYRREETAYAAGWLFDRLAEHLGSVQIFKDVDSIELGDDFVEVITRAVGSCDVLLALIGDEWLSVTDAHGRRLDNPKDFVRLEIEAALTRNVRIIPILVDGARMPGEDELPAGIAGLARRQALELSPSRFTYDTSRLLKVLDMTLADVRTAQSATAESTAATAATNTPDQRIGTQQSRQQPEQATQRRTPSIQPAVPATPGGDRPPADQPKPPDRQPRRVFTRARVIIAVGAGLLIVPLIVFWPQKHAVIPPTPTFSKEVFRDDFASHANGWDDAGSMLAGGHYKNGAYRVYAEPKEIDSNKGGAPRKADSVYESAPSNVRIEVKAKALSKPDKTAYGIGCRIRWSEAGMYGYFFTVENDWVNIFKLDVDGGYDNLGGNGFKFIAGETDRLEADCFGGEGDQAVILEFRVNGKVAATGKDTKGPLLTGGTVALFARTYEGSTEAVEAEFDDFVVKQ